MDQVDQIKQKIDIVDLVGGYVSIKKSGNNYKGLCPFHSEKTPSFMVSPDLQIFKCFGCNEAGDIFSFVQKIDGVDFSEALKRLAEKAGIKLEGRENDPNAIKKKTILEINHLTAEFYHYILNKHKIGANALLYLKEKRKITNPSTEKFNIGYAPDSWNSLFNFLVKKGYTEKSLIDAGVVTQTRDGRNLVDKFRGRVVFPMTGIDGRILGFMGRTIFDREPKYLNTGETLVFHKGNFIYGLDKAKISVKQNGAVFVEGPVDVISAHQAGFENVVATSGTALTIGQLNAIAKYTKDIAFCFDSDSAGMSAMHRAIALSESEGFNITAIIIPAGYKDLDELILKNKKFAFECLKNAVSVYDFFLAAALKKYNKNESIGKKKIVEEITPLFSKLTNKVTLDHYVKLISDELGITKEIVSEMLAGKQGGEDIDNSLGKSALKNRSLQEYILALFLKAPLDMTRTFLYKLGQKDFTDPIFQQVFAAIKSYFIGRRRKVEAASFVNKLADNLKSVVQEMYLWDFGDIISYDKELASVVNRLKSDSIKRELKGLGDRIRQAELEKDVKAVETLSEKFKEISKRLL